MFPVDSEETKCKDLMTTSRARSGLDALSPDEIDYMYRKLKVLDARLFADFGVRLHINCDS